MKAGDLVSVVHHDPNGPYSWTPVWDSVTLKPKGRAHHGQTALVVRTGLKKRGVGVVSGGWTGDAEIIHPELGQVLIEQAYLEVVHEAR